MGAKDLTIERNLTITELAEQTGLKVSFIRKAVREYGLPHYKLGTLLRFKVSEYHQWEKERQQRK